MRFVFVVSVTLFCLLATVPVLFAQPQAEREAPVVVVSGQREVGVVLLEEFRIKDGVLSFRTVTGGCTDKKSFRIAVREEKLPGGEGPHYALTIRRVTPDDCKGMFPEGVLIEINLERDLGLKGRYTLTVSNPLAPH